MATIKKGSVTETATNYQMSLGEEIKTLSSQPYQSGNNVLASSTTKLSSGVQYQFVMLFRPRGGNSTEKESGCSSMCFECTGTSYKYTHYSKEAYKDMGHFVKFDYTFVPNNNNTGWKIYIGVDGNIVSKRQEIDVYYWYLKNVKTGALVGDGGNILHIMEMQNKTKHVFIRLKNESDKVASNKFRISCNNSNFVFDTKNYKSEANKEDIWAGATRLSLGSHTIWPRVVYQYIIEGEGVLRVANNGMVTTNNVNQSGYVYRQSIYPLNVFGYVKEVDCIPMPGIEAYAKNVEVLIYINGVRKNVNTDIRVNLYDVLTIKLVHKSDGYYHNTEFQRQQIGAISTKVTWKLKGGGHYEPSLESVSYNVTLDMLHSWIDGNSQWGHHFIPCRDTSYKSTDFGWGPNDIGVDNISNNITISFNRD